MKLRIRGSSVRLRLTRGEVEQLKAGGTVQERLVLDSEGQGLTYTLQTAKNDSDIAAKLVKSELIITVPELAGRAWANSEEVRIANSESSTPRILIEKDFACLTSRPGEDEADMFPNPSRIECS